MRSIGSLPLLMLMLCLTACGGQRVTTTRPTWVQPIYLHGDTIEWLRERKAEWPPGLIDDLNQIDKHNRKVEAILHR